MKIKRLLPRTAALLGVIPKVKIRYSIADNAIPPTIIVTAESRKRIQISTWLVSFLEDSATEKKMMAITPISSALKIIRNSRSLYGSLPE